MSTYYVSLYPETSKVEITTEVEDALVASQGIPASAEDWAGEGWKDALDEVSGWTVPADATEGAPAHWTLHDGVPVYPVEPTSWPEIVNHAAQELAMARARTLLAEQIFRRAVRGGVDDPDTTVVSIAETAGISRARAYQIARETSRAVKIKKRAAGTYVVEWRSDSAQVCSRMFPNRTQADAFRAELISGAS